MYTHMHRVMFTNAYIELHSSELQCRYYYLNIQSAIVVALLSL